MTLSVFEPAIAFHPEDPGLRPFSFFIDLRAEGHCWPSTAFISAKGIRMPKPIWKRSCQQCGAKLKLAPSGRQKRFCSDACRQAAFRNEMTANKAPSYPSKGYENCASELIETQNDFLSRNEELELSPSSAHSSKEAKPAYLQAH
jgi:hypothetical protein